MFKVFFKPRTLNFEPRNLIFVLLAVAVIIPVVTKSRQGRLLSAPAAFHVSSSAEGYVRVSGEVRHPGIYPITANAVTDSVILLAEPCKALKGYVPAGSQGGVLMNGSDIRITIGRDGKARISNGSIPTAQRLVLGIPLDITSMDETDFDRIPGIGPVLARRIVQYRHNNDGLMDVRDLIHIDGIGEKKYARLKKYFN